MADGPNNQHTRGPLWLLAILAALPFAVKAWAQGLGAAGYLAQSAYKLFQLAAPLFWRRKFQCKSWPATPWPIDEPLPDRRTWLIAIGTAVLLVGSAIATILVLAGPLGLEPEQLKQQIDSKFQLTPLRAAAVVLYLLSINAALEELHFRAWLDRQIAARFGDLAGIGVSAPAFAAMHLYIFAGMQGVTKLMLLLLFVSLLIAGVCWSLIARRPGGIHAAWLSHGLTDAGLMSWGLFWLGYF